MKKILKRLTAVDGIIIILGTLFIIIFFIAFRREVTTTTATFKVTDESILYAINSPGNEFASSFMIGDTEKDELGRTVSEITDINSYNTTSDNAVVYVTIRMKAIYNPRRKQFAVRGKAVSFGEAFTFNFSRVKFRAVVVDFPGYLKKGEVENTTTTIRAQLRDPSRNFSDIYGVPDFLANAIKKGDSMKNSKGEILAKILDVQIYPSKRLMYSNGNAYTVSDPDLKDVFYTIELSTRMIHGQNYVFDFKPVLIGALLPLQFETVRVTPTIIEILSTKTRE